MKEKLQAIWSIVHIKRYGVKSDTPDTLVAMVLMLAEAFFEGRVLLLFLPQNPRAR